MQPTSYFQRFIGLEKRNTSPIHLSYAKVEIKTEKHLQVYSYKFTNMGSENSPLSPTPIAKTFYAIPYIQYLGRVH